MIHKEGKVTIILALIVAFVLGFSSEYFLTKIYAIIGIILAIALFLFIVSFFRNPKRTIHNKNNNVIYAPADGKVVVIEKVSNKEYPRDEGMQISIFMSPANVHVNRVPCDGKVSYVKHHQGKYLAAWNPKSSEENERWTSVIETKNGPILLKQIAGALARRICNYLHVDQQVKQGEDFGFIKLGSRVDIILPLNAKIEVDMDQKTIGNKTIIARFS